MIVFLVGRHIQHPCMASLRSVKMTNLVIVLQALPMCIELLQAVLPHLCDPVNVISLRHINNLAKHCLSISRTGL